jgi:hypothetical protein
VPLRLYLPFVTAVLIALTLFVGFSVVDILVYAQKPHTEYPPQFDLYHLARLLICVITSAWLVHCLPISKPTPTGSVAPMSALLLCVFTTVFIASPALFTALGVEDSLIEWASAILTFLASVLFLWTSLRLRKSDLPYANTASVIAFALAVLLFVLTMEEVSWLQRVFEFETPGAFSENGQKEFNLHNFKTNEVENLYYIGAFVLLFLLPILLAPVRAQMPGPLAAVAPTFTVAFASAPMAALNWDMWNIIPIQMMFWVAAFYFAGQAISLYRRQNPAWRTLTFMLLSLFASQMTYLVLGNTFLRQWDVTEYKELFISIGFFVFALQALKAATPPISISKNIPAGGK